MNIETQIATLESCVANFTRSVASLREEAYLATLGRWSPRDIVAHLTGWNRYIIRGSRQIMRGEIPFYDVEPGDNYSNVNAILIRDYASQDREELLAELQAAVQELIQFLQSLDHGEWERDYGVRHQGVKVTVQSTIDDLIRDYVHHRRQIEEWAKATAAQ